MTRFELIKRVRSLTRDFSDSIFRQEDIRDYINEGIERFVQYIPEFAQLKTLDIDSDSPTLVPTQYHHLFAVYSAARCFEQDERHYQGVNFMNEFETKMDELKIKIEIGEITIIDPETGLPITRDTLGLSGTSYVVDNYFYRRKSVELDEGVEGLE